ncbi:anti-sigma factor domain-containing protein [Nocardiopsis sp. NRRL B-16309]|uniref:anti-sigma factor n=1 Tax=Nocardiopsis sp. NRRL B-16309 TaxID=1519494 RepID=UPI001E2C63D5|nr:anti-sigma factor [Nocardiopsis sp. NRRL B-16309]
MRRPLSQDQHTLAGAYALHALAPSEAVRFEDHMAGCESCRQEVRGFSETAARLAAATARTPPEGLRARVLADVGRTRQLAPAPERLPEPRRRWGWGFGLVLAACLAVVVALGAVTADQVRQVRELRENERRIAAVLAAPDAAYTAAEPMEGVTVSLVYSESEGRLVFSSHGLAEPEDEDYQLWLTRDDGTVTSAGVLSIGESGVAEPLLAGVDEEEASGVAVTLEPEGGSEQPTSEPLMAMPLES